MGYISTKEIELKGETDLYLQYPHGYISTKEIEPFGWSSMELSRWFALLDTSPRRRSSLSASLATTPIYDAGWDTSPRRRSSLSASGFACANGGDYAGYISTKEIEPFGERLACDTVRAIYAGYISTKEIEPFGCPIDLGQHPSRRRYISTKEIEPFGG